MQQLKLTFIHGFMGHPSDWDQVCGALENCETNAIEIGVAKDWHSSLEQIAASIPDHSIVVGYSMGARLALGLAIEMREKCDGLVFISGNPGLESDAMREQRWIADQLVADRLKREPFDGFLRQWYQQDVFRTVPESIRRVEIERKQKRSPELWASILRVNSVAKQPNYWPQLKQLSIPALVVAGELDIKYREIANRIDDETGPNVSKLVMPGSGHMVHLEQPDLFVREMYRFVCARRQPG